MKKSPIIILLFFLAFCSDDKENETNIAGPEIEWISGGTTTSYTYSGGVVTGYTFYRQFKAIESGDVTIKVYVKEDEQASTEKIISIESGKEYSLESRANISGSEISNSGTNCLTVVFTSTGSSNSQEINVSSYLVPSYNEYLPDQYYCPTTLLIGEITFSEK